MRTYLTLSAIALAAAASLSSGVASAADEPAPVFTLSYNLGATSDYRVRGIKQNNSNPAAQGGIDLAHNSGLYVGSWASNVSDWTAANSRLNLEIDYYGGYKTEIAGFGVDVGTIYYSYPSSRDSVANKNIANTHEAYVGLTYGPLAFKTSYLLSKNYFATTDGVKDASGTVYYDLTLSQEVLPKLTAAVHAGYTDYKESASAYSSYGKFSYADYNLGLTYDLDGYLLGVKYYINDAKGGTKAYGVAEGNSLVKNGVAISVLKSF
jgi:uncharacterized protein (TIGR02001 family)